VPVHQKRDCVGKCRAAQGTAAAESWLGGAAYRDASGPEHSNLFVVHQTLAIHAATDCEPI
jgi:hypothetical protein